MRDRKRGTGLFGVRVCMCRVAIPEPVPQRGHLAIHGLSRLCDILQLTLQPSTTCLSPRCLFLSLLQLPLQLLHSKVPLLQLGGSKEARSCLWVSSLSSHLILITQPAPQTNSSRNHTGNLFAPNSPSLFPYPKAFHLLFPLPGSSSGFRYQLKCHLLREDPPVLCVSPALHSFLFIAFVTICNYLCLFIGFLCLSFSILKT